MGRYCFTYSRNKRLLCGDLLLAGEKQGKVEGIDEASIRGLKVKYSQVNHTIGIQFIQENYPNKL